MQKDIFVEIMNLIEKNTDMPLLLRDIPEWSKNDEKNQKIYKIYVYASRARNSD